MRQRAINFGAGPSQLPTTVLEQMKDDLVCFNTSGTGILELSHRSKQFSAVQDECEEVLRQLLKIKSDYSIIFTTGGATQQFSMIPMNLLRQGQVADYILTDHWSEMALAEAEKIGLTNIAASSKEQDYSTIPSNFLFSDKAAYCHITSNNTIFGTQFQDEPKPQAPLICDASSDLMSRQIDINKYGLIYAGAQKNLGVAGVCLVIVKNSLLNDINSSLPILMNYQTYSEHKSCYNTPPVFAIYALNLVLKWLVQQNGIAGIEEINRTKAKTIYDHIDHSEAYSGVAERGCRSLTNITFRINSNGKEQLEQQFIKEANHAGLIGLQGHRLVGGLRASLYNAISQREVEELVSFMADFEQKHFC